MNIRLYGVVGAIIIFLIAILGIGLIIKLFVSLLVLIIGTMVCINRISTLSDNNALISEREDINKKTYQFRQYIFNLSKEKITFTLDRRITGSRIIDESLQEILDFIIRDYVQSWYSSITDDKEFLYSVRNNAQKIAINIANRCVKY